MMPQKHEFLQIGINGLSREKYVALQIYFLQCVHVTAIIFISQGIVQTFKDTDCNVLFCFRL